eukprot:TRINITY_DN2011_c0_g3_i1.p1 TRINITY_DN2011_c0_g3~~TRINITY_DN2011_c0_g3_i1.p1  ORF type:complete len:338 (+),score=52.06 TRINITY_DN2011_c0_g3_i1:111-1016(+)
MLRCAPESGTPYVTGCQVIKGSIVVVLDGCGNEKYSLVRVHHMIGFVRQRHLVPIPRENNEAEQRRKKALLVFWILNRKKELYGMSCTNIISSICWEMVPWWLLPGLGETHRERCATKMLSKRTRRSNSASLSASRRKELANSLNCWKSTFSKRYGRGPHSLDVWTDPTVAVMYNEYERIGKEPVDGLTSEERHRRKALCVELRKWIMVFKFKNNKCAPTKKHVLSDPFVSPIYQEYLQLTSRKRAYVNYGKATCSDDTSDVHPSPVADSNDNEDTVEEEVRAREGDPSLSPPVPLQEIIA